MLGWMILFAVMVVFGAIMAFGDYPAAAPARMASIVFALLFLIGLLTRVVRGRVW